MLLVGLLGTRRTTRLFVLDVLGARSAEVARPLLRRYWPELTQQADLSPTLAALLEVAEDPKRSRWPWSCGTDELRAWTATSRSRSTPTPS